MIELQPGETIVALYRRHWFLFFLIVFRAALAAAAVIAVPFAVLAFAPAVYHASAPFLYLGAVLALEIIWVFFFLGVTDYYLDTWIMTDRRVLLVELKGLFDRTVSSVDYGNIQDIASRMTGLIPTLLNFGNVVIQSAGTFGEHTLSQVPRPNAVKEQIFKIQREFLVKRGT